MHNKWTLDQIVGTQNLTQTTYILLVLHLRNVVAVEFFRFLPCFLVKAVVLGVFFY